MMHLRSNRSRSGQQNLTKYHPLRLLKRVVRDTRGNSLILMGAALLPLLGAIGSGVDMARAYMVRTKLQQAVDAAALAGRRAMTGDNIETARPQASSYLAFNFPNGMYGTTPVISNITKPDVGEVKVEATTSVPTSIMAVFGYNKIDVSVTGVAVQTFKNVDIMLVLDTTGSMNNYLGGERKIDALKSAVRTLYQQLTPARTMLDAKGLRMRFGIVPYASTTNVGKLLYRKSASYIRTNNVPYYHWKVTRGGWNFGEQRYNLSSFAAGNNAGDLNGDGRSDGTWGGCIEERKTDPGITANDTRDAAPSAAIDLDIDRIPDANDDTKYAPYIYDPALDDINESCPAEATELTELRSSSELETLLAKLVPRGSTYHDLGMVWGTRMISGGGIWGSTNPDMYKQISVQRYIIYMTDGMMDTPMDSYSSYGIENYNRRIGATGKTDNELRHTKRFLMTCNAAKAKSISIWTIAFGTSGRVAALDRCASSIDQSSTADSSDDLIERFATIGKSIGALRLAQ